MHEKSKGEILVYMDDDDYYHLIGNHAVNRLRGAPNALCAEAVLFIFILMIRISYIVWSIRTVTLRQAHLHSKENY